MTFCKFFCITSFHEEKWRKRYNRRMEMRRDVMWWEDGNQRGQQTSAWHEDWLFSWSTFFLIILLLPLLFYSWWYSSLLFSCILSTGIIVMISSFLIFNIPQPTRRQTSHSFKSWSVLCLNHADDHDDDMWCDDDLQQGSLFLSPLMMIWCCITWIVGGSEEIMVISRARI